MNRSFKKRLTDKDLDILRQEGATEEDLRLIKEASDPVLWGETYLNDPDLGDDKLECKDQFKDILRDPALNRAARVGRQQGKCESEYTRIQLSDGSCPTAGELYRKYGDGARFNIISTCMDTFKHTVSEAYINDNGIKSLVKVTTASGHETTNTDNHPYLIWRDGWIIPDWVEGKDLRIGDHIAVTANLDIANVSDEDSILTPEEAYRIGQHVEVFELKVPGDVLYTIPSIIFKSGRKAITSFVETYWNIDINCLETYNKDKLIKSSYNPIFLKDMRSLLLRLGITSKLYYNTGLWVLEINSRHDNKDSDIIWEKIIEVENLKEGKTYAITVENTHNLITDNIISHNTVHMCVDILHTAGTTKRSIILIFVPEKKNMNRMLEIMSNFLKGSELSRSFVMGSKKTIKGSLEPEYDYEIKSSTGSVIRFFFMSMKPDKARGQSATDIYIDEAEYLPDKAWPVIDGIVKGNPKIPIWASSTPSGLENTWFRNFCDRCSDPKNDKGSEYHIPSTMEKNWKEIEERLRDLIHDEVTWKLEVLAEWAEARGAVYKKEVIDAAVERSTIAGRYLNLDEIRSTLEYKTGAKYLGVDWNNPQNGVRIVDLTEMFGKLWVTRNEKISYEQYTQTYAVERIMELYKENKYEVMSFDVGYGETQIELIQKQLLNMGIDPSNVMNMVDSVKREKMEIVYDSPDTGARRKNTITVRTKTKIVGLVAKYLEDMMVLPKCEDDHKEGLVKELRNFKRKNNLREGGFQYSENTHSLSALQMCMHGYDTHVSKHKISIASTTDGISSTNIIKTIRDTKSSPYGAGIVGGNFTRSNGENRSRTAGLINNGRTRRVLL